MARPTKKTPDIEAKLFKALGNGMSRESACQFAGIQRDTLLNWTKASDRFSAKVDEIESGWELKMIEAATNGITKQPKLAVDLLERRRASWSRDNQSQLASGRNTIAPALVIALMQAPEKLASAKQAQVIELQ